LLRGGIGKAPLLQGRNRKSSLATGEEPEKLPCYRGGTGKAPFLRGLGVD